MIWNRIPFVFWKLCMVFQPVKRQSCRTLCRSLTKSIKRGLQNLDSCAIISTTAKAPHKRCKDAASASRRTDCRPWTFPTHTRGAHKEVSSPWTNTIFRRQLQPLQPITRWAAAICWTSFALHWAWCLHLRSPSPSCDIEKGKEVFDE